LTDVWDSDFALALLSLTSAIILEEMNFVRLKVIDPLANTSTMVLVNPMVVVESAQISANCPGWLKC